MKNFFYRLGARLAVLPALLLPASVSAQISGAETTLGEVGRELGTADVGLEELIANIINVLLAALGIVFLVLVVYAGFLYLTSQGDPEKAKKAIKLLTQAVIGLVIIIAAYAIAAFVIGQLATVVG